MDFETLNQLASSSSRVGAANFRDEYETLRVLGKGSFGTVHLVRRLGHHTKYVAKEIPFFDDSNGKFAKSMMDMAANEAHVLAHVSHPNIVRYYATVQQSDRIYLVMEYVAGGDLKRAIDSQKICGEPFPEKTVVLWMRQLLLALQHIHQQNILHRDVKPANIFLSGDWRAVKLGDFGLTKALESEVEQACTICGTPQYFSPELCMKSPYTSLADIWAAGCVMFELMFLEHPFRGKSISETMTNIVSGKVCSPTLKPAAFSAALHASLAGMLARNPSDRLSATQLLSMPPFDSETVHSEVDLVAMQRLRSRVVEKATIPATHR